MGKEVWLLYHNLSVMLDAGMPILRALDDAVSGLKGRLPRVHREVSKAVSQGSSLSEAMARYPRVFASLDVQLIETGETSGNLVQSFKLLEQWYGFSGRIRRIIISGMALPILLIGIAALLAPLPFLFLGVIGYAGYAGQIARILALFYVPAGAILAIIYLTPKAGPLRRLLDWTVLRIPVLRKALRWHDLSRYCRAFSLLYQSGVPITQCADSALEVTENSMIVNLLKGGAVSIRLGKAMSEGFSEKLGVEFLGLWRTGEETGDLDKVAQRLGENFAQQSEQGFKELAEWLPRIAYWYVSIIIIINIFKGYAAIMSR